MKTFSHALVIVVLILSTLIINGCGGGGNESGTTGSNVTNGFGAATFTPATIELLPVLGNHSTATNPGATANLNIGLSSTQIHPEISVLTNSTEATPTLPIGGEIPLAWKADYVSKSPSYTVELKFLNLQGGPGIAPTVWKTLLLARSSGVLQSNNLNRVDDANWIVKRTAATTLDIGSFGTVDISGYNPTFKTWIQMVACIAEADSGGNFCFSTSWPVNIP